MPARVHPGKSRFLFRFLLRHAQPSKNSNTNPKEGNTMSHTGATQQRSDETIRPFQMTFPEAELIELRTRINATRWPERQTVADAMQGVQLETTQALARYWGTEYDWRK
jgi:hypothetical protein